MTDAEPLHDDLVTDVGVATVLHRLALAVDPYDGLTGLPLPGVVVLREPPPSRRTLRPGRPRVLRYGEATGAGVRLLVRDPAQHHVPRRIDVALLPVARVKASDPAPRRLVTDVHVPAGYRSVRPRLLPGPAFPVPPGATGARLRFRTAAGGAVPWPRVQIFGAGGVRLGHAHGDARGELLLLLGRAALGVLATDPTVAIRVHRAGPPGPPDLRRRPPDPADPLALLPAEPLPLPPLPVPAPQPRAAFPPPDLDTDAALGFAPPPGYVAVAGLTALRLAAGEVVIAPDQIVA